MLIYHFKSNYMYNLTLSDMKSNWFIAQHVSQTVASCLNGQFLNRAGYRVRYFLGTDRITSIPSSIEKHLVVRLISSTSVRQYACSTRCVRLEVMRHRSISIWHPRERFESVRSSLYRALVFTTHRLKHVTLAVTSASAVSPNEDIHEQHLQNCSESHFMSILPFDFSKSSHILYTQSQNWQPVKIPQQKYIHIVPENVHTATTSLLLKLLFLNVFK